ALPTSSTSIRGRAGGTTPATTTWCSTARRSRTARASRSSSRPRRTFSAGARDQRDSRGTTEPATACHDVAGWRPGVAIVDALAIPQEARHPGRDPADAFPRIAGPDGRWNRAATHHHRPERRQPVRVGSYLVPPDVDDHRADLWQVFGRLRSQGYADDRRLRVPFGLLAVRRLAEHDPARS